MQPSRGQTPYGVLPLVGKGKPSLGAHKAKQPPGRALTQRGTTQRRPARWRASNHRGTSSGMAEKMPTFNSSAHNSDRDLAIAGLEKLKADAKEKLRE